MIREYAVDPESIECWDCFKVIVGGCGVDKGRIIADFPKREWAKRVMEAFETCPSNKPLQMTRAEEMLREILPAIIRMGRSYDATQDWIPNAIKSDSEKAFAAIVVGDTAVQHKTKLCSDMVTETDPLWASPANISVARDAASLANCILPLLAISQEVIFVDPQFYPSNDRFQKSLSAFLDVLDSTKRQYHRVEYHTVFKHSDDPEEFEADAKECLPAIIPQGRRVRVVGWERQAGKERPHSRYILTDVGGIAIDSGLDAQEGEETTDVHRLSSGVYLKRWDDYQSETTSFAEVKSFSIVGSRI